MCETRGLAGGISGRATSFAMNEICGPHYGNERSDKNQPTKSTACGVSGHPTPLRVNTAIFGHESPSVVRDIRWVVSET
jgi:hypothetical protein